MFNLFEQLDFDKNYRVTASTIGLNRFFYYLKVIPVIGPRLANRFFRLRDFSITFSRFLLVLNYLLVFAKNIFFVVFFMLWVVWAHGNQAINFAETGLAAWAVLACLVTPLANGLIVGGLSEELYRFSSWFHLNPKLAVYNNLIVSRFVNSAAYAPVLLVAGLLVKNPLLGVNLTLIYLSMQLGSVALNLGVLKRTPFNPRKQGVWPTIFGLIPFLLYLPGLAFVQFFPRLDSLAPMLASPVTTVLSAAGVVVFDRLFVRSLRTFPLSKVIDIYQSDREVTIEIDEADENGYVISGQDYIEKLKLDKDSEAVSTNYTDNNFLNYLLFKRYRGILARRLRSRILTIVVFSALALAVCLYFKFVQHTSFKDVDLLSVLPAAFFFMYVLAMGKDIVSLCFVNCDQAMLYHPFYREPNAIIRGFFFRFKKSLAYNLPIALAMAVGFMAVQYVVQPQTAFQNYLVILATFVSLGFLFSFHYLFVYYILQPFAVDGSIQNPIFKIVDFFFYFIALMQTHSFDLSRLVFYPLVIIVLATIYVGLGALAIYRFAPKTFKIWR